jgi:hypothetical protein
MEYAAMADIYQTFRKRLIAWCVVSFEGVFNRVLASICDDGAQSCECIGAQVLPRGSQLGCYKIMTIRMYLRN